MGEYPFYDGFIEILPMERIPELDCHCHILPGLDDGAQTLEDSLYLAERLANYGYKRIVCTAIRRKRSSPLAKSSKKNWTGAESVYG